jgi:hypothetical protein
VFQKQKLKKSRGGAARAQRLSRPNRDVHVVCAQRNRGLGLLKFLGQRELIDIG